MNDNLGTNPSVTIQIINWNGMAYLEQCLNSVYAQDYRGAIEVLLIDNASTDGSLDIVLRKFPQVRIIRNQGNLGFSRGHNLGI